MLERLGDATPDKGFVLFQTGYGPSGLPHIGTFGEVVRTTMVRQAIRRALPAYSNEVIFMLHGSVVASTITL